MAPRATSAATAVDRTAPATARGRRAKGSAMLKDRTYLVGRDRRQQNLPSGRERRTAGSRRAQRYIAIPHDTVGLPHAEIIVLGGTIYVRDLRSESGTFLLRDDRKIPFNEGYVEYDEFVFFGHCLRLVGQMIEAHEEDSDRSHAADAGQD